MVTKRVIYPSWKDPMSLPIAQYYCKSNRHENIKILARK